MWPFEGLSFVLYRGKLNVLADAHVRALRLGLGVLSQ